MSDDGKKSYCYIDHANKKSEVYKSSPQLYRFNQKRKKRHDSESPETEPQANVPSTRRDR